LSKRLLITGGCGIIGTILRASLESKYPVTCLDLKRCGENCLVGDIANLEEIKRHFRNQDVVIHLAENSRHSLWGTNLFGTYNVIRASLECGVGRIIFSSSNHVTGLYERKWPISKIVRGEYSGLRPEDIPTVNHKSLPKPDSFYGVSKLLGDRLLQFYSYRREISVICLRIGTVRPIDNPGAYGDKRFFATWMTHRDLGRLMDKCIEASNVKFDIFYGVSNNKWRFWDLTHTRQVIGFEPIDNAESFRTPETDSWNDENDQQTLTAV
jgi:uronate dehydrogenase